MKREFSLIPLHKKGEAKGKGVIYTLIAVVILLVFVGALAPSTLTTLYNSSLYGAGVPTFVSTVLGLIGVAGFIFVVLKAI